MAKGEQGNGGQEQEKILSRLKMLPEHTSSISNAMFMERGDCKKPSDQERRKQFPEEKKDVGDTSSFLI